MCCLFTRNGLTLKHGSIYNFECSHMAKHKNVGKTSSAAMCHDRINCLKVDTEVYAHEKDSTWNTACAF